MPKGWRLTAVWAAAAFGLALAGEASAQCTTPHTLTNGQVADASQVMANFNAVTACVNALPGGSVNTLQVNGGPGVLSSIGPMTNGQLAIGSTGAAPAAATLTPGSGIVITNGPGSITIAASGATGGSAGGQALGRLTLTSGHPVMSADVVGAAMVYYDCYTGNTVPYYTGTADAAGGIAGCEISTALKASGTGALKAGDVFDLFFNGSLICVATNGSGSGWSGDTGGSITARGTGYSNVHNVRGYWTNAASLPHCYNGTTDTGAIAVNKATYLGSLYTTAAGQTAMQFDLTASANGGTAPVAGLWNAYNRVTATSASIDNAGGNNNSWVYNSAAWRTKNGSSNNRISQVDGLGIVPINILIFQYVCPGAQSTVNIGVDLDSISTTPFMSAQSFNNGACEMVNGYANFLPQLGFHFEQAMEAQIEGGNADIFFGMRDGSQTNGLLLSWSY